jgi:hypothetical protein
VDTPPVVIDLAKEERERGPDPHNWNGDERKALEEFLKVTYGLNGEVTGSGDNTGVLMCNQDIRSILFPGIFYECTRRNQSCTFRHGLTAIAAGGPYLDGSEAEKAALRAFVPSYTAAIAAGTLKKMKAQKKGKGK